jgi:release factor glutamine methyltransferase
MKHWIKEVLRNELYNQVSLSLREIEKRDKQEVVILGEKFVQYADVFPADTFKDTEIFTNVLKVIPNEDFLEIGVGSGVTSILMAKSGANVVGVDINEKAVLNAKENARLHNIEHNTEFFVSDVFDKISGKVFDTIYWNVPFCFSEIEELSNLEKSVFDYQYKSLEKFIGNSKSFLKPNGRLLIGFSNVWGLSNKLINLLYKFGYKNITTVNQTDVKWGDMNYDLTLYQLRK